MSQHTLPKHSPKRPPGSPIRALPPLRCSLRWPQRRLQKLLDLQRVRLDIPIIEQDGQLRAWREVLQHIQCPVDTRQKGGGWPGVGRSQGGVQGCVSPSCVHCGECEGHTLEEKDHEEPLAGRAVSYTLAVFAGLGGWSGVLGWEQTQEF